MKPIIIKIYFLLALCLLPVSGFATSVYQEPDEFIQEVYAGKTPEVKRLWIKKDLKKSIREIMQRDLGVLRLRYWLKDGRTAWILDEIGKEKPITTGIVINNNQIEQLKVLIFRESRGWEVRHPFFTDQFKQLGLDSEKKLTGHIDAISGATLSRNALIKVSRLALFLDNYVQQKINKKP